MQMLKVMFFDSCLRVYPKMYVCSVFMQQYSSSTIVRRLGIHIRQPLPRNIYLKRLERMQLRYRTADYRASWISTKQFVSNSYNVTMFSAMCSGLQKNVTRILNPTSVTVESHEDITCQYQSNGIVHLLKRVLWNAWEFCLILLRILKLTFVFTPLLLLYPVTRLSSNVKNFWYRLVLFDLEFCGPIFVKLGQWASTRRDLFPEELCTCLSKLQRKIRPHSWFYTKYCLKKAYGAQWKQIFVNFDNGHIPVGSGCCAQVYKAWVDPEALHMLKKTNDSYEDSSDSLFVEGLEMFGLGTFLDTKDHNQDNSAKGCEEMYEYRRELIPVALKVRHPRMEIMLRRDLAILKAMASIVTSVFPSLKWLSLVDCVEDFAQLMKAQVDLCVEGHNLDKFSANFKGMESVKFPRPVWSLTRCNILVETYEEGQPMQNFVTDVSANSINVKLAELGINTILKMVFEDNFAHGDLHPGNMLVQKKSVNELKIRESKGIFPFSFVSKPIKFPVNLVILDCGITATLDDRGKKCLKGVFAAVADGDGEKVGELFLNHSNHECNDPESFKCRMREIVNTALDKSVTLEQIEVSSLLSSLFSAMIDHRVKLDGSFSSIILAIMVLEGLGRSLDPTIDIIEKAKPFLLSSM